MILKRETYTTSMAKKDLEMVLKLKALEISLIYLAWEEADSKMRAKKRSSPMSNKSRYLWKISTMEKNMSLKLKGIEYAVNVMVWEEQMHQLYKNVLHVKGKE